MKLIYFFCAWCLCTANLGAADSETTPKSKDSYPSTIQILPKKLWGLDFAQSIFSLPRKQVILQTANRMITIDPNAHEIMYRRVGYQFIACNNLRTRLLIKKVELNPPNTLYKVINFPIPKAELEQPKKIEYASDLHKHSYTVHYADGKTELFTAQKCKNVGQHSLFVDSLEIVLPDRRTNKATPIIVKKDGVELVHVILPAHSTFDLFCNDVTGAENTEIIADFADETLSILDGFHGEIIQVQLPQKK